MHKKVNKANWVSKENRLGKEGEGIEVKACLPCLSYTP